MEEWSTGSLILITRDQLEYFILCNFLVKRVSCSCGCVTFSTYLVHLGDDVKCSKIVQKGLASSNQVAHN